MARANKYSSLNFNDIYEKKITSSSTSPSSSSLSKSPSSSSSSLSSNKSYSFSASARLGHGGMLVLSRPYPKPSPPSPSPPLSPSPHNPNRSVATHPTKSSDSDSISLRPQGKTGSAPAPGLERENKEASVVPIVKTDKFVPPHLRPGFVARDQTPVPPAPRPGNYRPGSGHGHHGSPSRPGEDGRPNSGGGQDRRVRGVGAPAGDSDRVDVNRPRSRGSRPSSSGWYFYFSGSLFLF
uniref:Uncharacterized protein n=2 Tax=Opuntia streptacantha TaxID=393608 RepID=A0A7C9CSU7_OPUST